MKYLALKIPGMADEIKAPSGIPTGGLESDGGRIIGFILTMLLVVSLLLALAFIVWGGLNYMTSQGDKAKLESARKMIVFSLIGLLIVFLSFFAMNLVGSTLGVDLFNLSL